MRGEGLSVLAEQQVNNAAYAGRPGVCRSCGALVGAGEAACAVCGAPYGAGADGARGPRQDAETMRFARAVLTRPATFTFVFLAVNVFLYLLMTFAGGAQGNVLIAYGAKLNSLIRERHEWWRFVTPIFLHVQMPGVGPAHLLVNMYGLWNLGPFVERLYGSAKFVVFWIATGVAGVLASYLTVRPDLHVNSLGRFLFKAYDIPSAGASGALFGLIGVLFIFGIKFRRELPAEFRRAFGTGMLPMILINLVIGYMARGIIDNAAHLGGFAAGCVLALVVGYRRPGERGPVAVVWHVLQIAALVLVVASFGEVARHLGDARPHFDNPAARLMQPGPDIEGYIAAVNEGQRTLPLVITRQADAAAADRLIAQLDRVPPFDTKADALRGELKQLLVRARGYNQLPDKERAAPRNVAQVKQIVLDYQAWETRFDQWVRNDGKNYGLYLQDEPPADKSSEHQGKQPPAPDKK